jgi:hypothetical protein
MGADARLINRFGLASATRWPRLIKPSDFQASRSPRARRVYTTLIAPGRRYRSVNLYYSARTMRLPARVYLKLDPCTSSAVARARARTCVAPLPGKFIDALSSAGNVDSSSSSERTAHPHERNYHEAHIYLCSHSASRSPTWPRCMTSNTGSYSSDVRITYQGRIEDWTITRIKR